VARAQIATVLLGIPDPPYLAKSAHAESDMIEFIRDLDWRPVLQPNAPLTRPATNADWIDPLVDLASLAPLAVGPAFRAVGEGAAVAADSSAVAVDAPFIILPSELPAEFDITLPIGRFIPKTDLHLCCLDKTRINKSASCFKMH